MAFKTLANPTVEINDVAIAIKPNSLKLKSGKGDINIRPQSAGGNSIQIVKTDNAETKKGMVTFSLFNTKQNIDAVKSWQDSEDGNTIQLSEGDFIQSFRQMFVMTDPEISLGADGELEIVFEGLPST